MISKVKSCSPALLESWIYFSRGTILVVKSGPALQSDSLVWDSLSPLINCMISRKLLLCKMGDEDLEDSLC